MEIILASKSPRRRELLTMMGVKEYSVQPAVGEECAPQGASPQETVRELARQKAAEIAAKHPDALVIAADTLVFLDGKALGKPKSPADAVKMLQSLSGRSHQVCTGVSLALGEKTLTEAETTTVVFRALTEGEIRAYVATGEPMDKAGAYGAQSMGAMLVDRIDGDFFNVMGLPVSRLYIMLQQFGLHLLG